MITCPHCQHLEYEGELLCSNCGKPLKADKPRAAGKGTKVKLEAEGADAEAALVALTKLIAERFGEGE